MLWDPPPPPPYFFFFETFRTHPLTPPPPLSPTDLFTYIFNFKVGFSPSTYSPINVKCATLTPTHLFALPPTYLPNPTYMATPTYLVGTPIDPPTIENDQEIIK